MTYIQSHESQLYHWKNAVLLRDNYTCYVCGNTNSVQAHHCVPISQDKRCAYNVNNGIALCKQCHTAIHTIYKNSGRPLSHRAVYDFKKGVRPPKITHVIRDYDTPTKCFIKQLEDLPVKDTPELSTKLFESLPEELQKAIDMCVSFGLVKLVKGVE